jgi:hypothetical protein
MLRIWHLVKRLYVGIRNARGGCLEGVIYFVMPTELRRSDAYEGYPNIYKCVKIIVHAKLILGVDGNDAGQTKRHM